MAQSEIELARCPIFQEMSPEECRQVLDLVECVSYPAGESILREGRSIQMLWIICSGRCEVFKSMPDGKAQQLALLEAGAVFGEMSFFRPSPHSASVRALTDVEIMRLSRGKYDELKQTGLAAAHKVAVGTVNALAERLRRMDEWAYEIVQRPDAANHRAEWREFRAKLYSDWQF